MALEELKLRLTSAKVEVEVEVEAELGKNQRSGDGNKQTFSCLPLYT